MFSLRTAAFRAWFRLSRSMTMGVRGIVEDEHGRVLLVRHTYVPGLHFPGGGVEHGEPCEEALRRELFEEAGITGTAPPELLGVFSNHPSFKNDHVLLYRLKAWHQQDVDNAREISELVWADPLALPADTTDGTRRRIEAVYSGAERGLFW